MNASYTIGLLAVSASAVLLAFQWQQGRANDSQVTDGLHRQFLHRQRRRRTVASSLVGVIGAALTAFDQVPQTPRAIAAYLLFLILATCWILLLGISDFFASRKFHQQLVIQRIAEELKQASVPTAPKK